MSGRDARKSEVIRVGQVFGIVSFVRVNKMVVETVIVTMLLKKSL